VVQGVGFRPFVYRLAGQIGIVGWVLNDARGVLTEIQGSGTQLDQFEAQLQSDLPALASISALYRETIPATDNQTFVIRESTALSQRSAQIAPDSYVCDDCIKELFDPADRRYHYPFINCTNCGPRYSIVTGIPYDRPQTTMVHFSMCPSCRQEYDNPIDRRFHAQPNACPVCGPRLQLFDPEGQEPAEDPLVEAVKLLNQGRILAVKGLGGYHLVVDPENHSAVVALRRRKARDKKPFALMCRDLDSVRAIAEASSAELQLLVAPERPIVLLRQRRQHAISSLVAPNNRYFGVMLPGTPLHYLLLEHFSALVMTSGNLSDEPIAFEDEDARRRLGPIAAALLTHNRPIHTRCDDSISRIMGGKPLLLRRSRGYVPRGLKLPVDQKRVLAVGAELKNTICLTLGDQAYLSQHIGDLKNVETFTSFEQSIMHLQGLLQWQPEVIAHDLHPAYQSTHYAKQQRDVRIVAVQHHHAHLVSCMAENGVVSPCIGVIFDGIGYGDDGHIWGGEFLLGDFRGYRRVGHFAYLPMPGGDAATREPYRMALSALHHAFGKDIPDLDFLQQIEGSTLDLLRTMLRRQINCPLTSSCGRLFDAVAALVGLRNRIHYEGQAALELEMVMTESEPLTPYPYRIVADAGMLVFDPAVTIRAIVEDLQGRAPAALISGRFHQTLVVMLHDVCCRVREQSGISQVALSGGVFQNRFLTETAYTRLRQSGFSVLTHSLVPPNDGGIALGQAVIAGQVH
jgi:hydrogenase maturation protein HypF